MSHIPLFQNTGLTLANKSGPLLAGAGVVGEGGGEWLLPAQPLPSIPGNVVGLIYFNNNT